MVMPRTPILTISTVLLFWILCSPRQVSAQHSDLGKKAYQQSQLSVEHNKYLDDAYRLALRLSYPKQDFREQAPEIPTDLVDKIYESLIAIYHSELPECKAISRDIRIHSKPYPVTDRISVLFQNELRLIEFQESGSAEGLMALVESYDLQWEKSFPAGAKQEGWVLLSEGPLNMAGLGEKLGTFSEIHTVLHPAKGREGTDIEVEYHPNGLTFNFILTWGACAKDCENKHYWTFLVDNQKQVNFLQDGGTPLPEWWTSK